jgi:signal transduction histidine kinase
MKNTQEKREYSTTHRQASGVEAPESGNKLAAQGKNLIVSLALTMLATLVGICAYESVRRLIFPHLTIWASHITTIILSSVIATAVAYLILRKSHSYTEAHSPAAQLAAVNRISRAVGTPLHLDDLLETVYQEITALFSAEAFFIALCDPDAGELDFRIQVDKGVRSQPQRQPLGHGLTSLVVTEKRPLLIRDYERERHHLPSPRLWGTNKPSASWLGVPMQVGGQVVGVICVQAYRPHAYDEEKQLLLSTIADQVAVAIENTRLFEAERQRAEEIEALEKAAAIVSSSLELDEVLDHILEQVEQVVAGDTFNIILIENENGRVVRWRGYEQLGVPRPSTTEPMPIARFPNLAKIAQAGETLVIPDTTIDPDWVPLEGREWLRSYVCAPIRMRDSTVGFLNVNGTRPGQFTPADAKRLEAFAAHAATAIENARLYRALLNHAEQLEQRVQERTAQLQAQYARLEATLHSTTDGIIVTDAGGDILQTNPIAHVWLTRALPPDDAARLREMIGVLAQQAEERPSTVLELTGLDLELKAAPVVEEGKEKSTTAVVAAHDVSHLKALDRMKSRFVSNVSHELRTPITTIKLYAALMQRTPPEKWGEYLDALAQEADRQAQLVENILQISHIDTGRLEMELRPVSLDKLAAETIASHRLLAQEHGLSLEHRGSEPEPVALVDEDRILQTLNNLLENAIHYTPEGGKIVVSTGKKKKGGHLWTTVKVADTGIGIPEEELPHVFERFFRGKEPRTMQTPGTGLGLAIVKEIVEYHGGQVTVASQVGRGTTFALYLPPAENTGETEYEQ